MAYGIKDVSDLLLVHLETGVPALYVDYANASSSEWTAESVFATKKGRRAIRWDDDRQGTLTLESELFDIGLLAMVMGSEVAEGEKEIFTRTAKAITADRTIKLETDGQVDEETISVLRVDKDSNEHIGLPLINTTTVVNKIPDQVIHLTISASDTVVKGVFTSVAKAESYVIMRDGVEVAQVYTNEFEETGLTAADTFEYQIYAVNAYGQGAKSPVVEVQTAAAGVTTFTPYTPTAQAITDAESNVGSVNQVGSTEVTFTYADGEVALSANAIPGDEYAVYFMDKVQKVKTLTINADKFPGSYEIFANSQIRDEKNRDELCQIHYFNAKPQSNFTLTQSATEPTSLSIVFDLFGNKDNILAEMNIIE